MKAQYKIIISVLILSIVFFSSCEKPWQTLFNGENLDGWDVYVGPKEEGEAPIGLNNDPLKIFSVVWSFSF